MRTQKRFTPELLERYLRLGRGKGTYEDYVPWHRVGRSDPASSGRSHLQVWRGRQRELLSDQEWIAFLFTTMLAGVVDIREQFPLRLDSSLHEISAYDLQTSALQYSGTLKIAEELHVKHPKVHGNGRSAHWIMTTDLLLTLKGTNGETELLAIAVKPAVVIAGTRTWKLLAIEQEYWRRRNVQWLLITPKLYHPLVSDALRNCMPWSLDLQVDKSLIDFVVTGANDMTGHSLTKVLAGLTAQFGSVDVAQRAFWQAVWSGRLTIDLRRGWRPHEPLILLPELAFWKLNPIASRRSSWA